MSEQNKAKADNWIRSAVQAVVIVVSTWQLFTKEIHGYIDTKMEVVSGQMVRTISAQATGQMLQVMDSTKLAIQAHQDTMAARLTKIEERIGMRGNTRTVVVTPDTAALMEMQRRLSMIEQGIEAILDGSAGPATMKRRRAHNSIPQD